jgi:energy-coupling factor transporter ATPase
LSAIIRIEKLQHSFQPEGGSPVHALRGVDLTIAAGEYVAILGANGSGKSTLARHLNGLLLPSAGDVWVKDWNSKEKHNLRDIRSTVGMVFQTPDNQIVATIVEEDVAFGPENLGVPRNEIIKRVTGSLEQVNMKAFRHRAPHMLSGGQKQRICIAGVLAMQPEVIVFDESTAMLDPLGRKEVLEIAHRLHKEQGRTIIAITHFMHEALQADRVIVMSQGQIVMEGTPRQIFRQAERLRELNLDVPQITQLAHELHRQHANFPADILTTDEFVTAIERLGDWELAKAAQPTTRNSQFATRNSPALITVDSLVHYYMRGTPLEVKALYDIDMEIHRGEIVGILGHTGSGKSTVVQHFNGLLRPHEGKVQVMGQDLGDPKADVKKVRQQVGLVFQFPESQLFEQYVGDDIAFGPRNLKLGNLKLSKEEIRERVRKAMTAVGLDFDEFKDRLTFRLSGGQMRRVALAGVLALQPEVLVLDEPTAGLDPQGRKQLLQHILALHSAGTTLVMISHNMEELAEVCDRLYVLADGKTLLHGSAAEVFGDPARLQQLGLDVPPVMTLFEELRNKSLLPADAQAFTVAQAAERLGGVVGSTTV